MSNPIIELKAISKEYRQGRSCIQALRSCNYKAEQGSINAIVGPSGCGKSTLLHIAGLLDRPTTGQVYFDGEQVDGLSNRDAAQLRLSHMGFVYQYHHLLRDFSALENVMMPLLLAGISNQEAINDAHQILDQLGLTKRLYNYPDELSGGEQQRVAIARAIVHKPKLILADEPTGNLDPEASEQVFGLLVDLVREHNLTAIIVTHDHQLAKKTDSCFQLSV